MLSDLIYRMDRELASMLERERQLREDAGLLVVMLKSKQQEISHCRRQQDQIREDMAKYSTAIRNTEWEAS